MIKVEKGSVELDGTPLDILQELSMLIMVLMEEHLVNGKIMAKLTGIAKTFQTLDEKLENGNKKGESLKVDLEELLKQMKGDKNE